jgi:acetylornithine deacetylase
MRLCLAHKGFVWLAVTTHGVAYHGSEYRHGVDANMRMIRALGPLAELQERLLTEDGHPLLGPPSLHLGVLEGGDGPSIYASRSRGQIEVRTLPGAAGIRPLEEIAAIVERARTSMPADAIELETTLIRPPFEAASDSALAASLTEVATSVLGALPAVIGVPYWADAAFVREQGADTVVFGPSGAGAHADDEWVELASVYECAEIYVGAALEFCGG